MAVFAAATASPTDGAAQSCTKRKEDDLSIKAITSYFSPLGKNVESVLSLPKSNNIMDYFKKTINENIASPLLEQESKANSASLENSSRPPSKLKWRGKRNNLNNKLKTDKTLEPEPLVELNKDNDKETTNPLEENYKASFMSHNDVALNSLTNGEETLNVCREGSLSTVSYNNEKRKAKIEGTIVKSNAKKLKRRNPKNEMDLFENSTTDTQTKDSGKETNKQIASITESENRSLLLTPDPETNAQMTPQLNENTVTISFEDFLKSQGEDFEQILRKQTSDDFVASDKTDVYQGTQHLPLKKVTVLAQIHSVPPKSLRSQKIASIFVNAKSKAIVKKTPSSSEMEYTEQVTQKRKSNVVIAEEELELAVLESTASETVKLKCTAEERYQFMKAFRQPGAEIVKNGAKRGPSKQKEVEEKSSSHKLEGEECEDHSNQNTPNNALIAYGSSTAHDITEKYGRTRVKNKSRKRKGIVEAEEKDFNINHNQNNNAHGPINRTTPTEKEREFSQKSKGLRRHCRQKIRQNTPAKAMVSQAVTENPPDAPPLQTSTPKTNRSFKNNLYTAEVITEPFDSNSPIRMKFTRINTSDRFTQQNVKVNSTSRSIFKAKKLVEKAKAVQHNRISRTVEEGSHISLRRSSRQRALAEKKRLEKIENSDALDSGTWSLTTVSGHTENPKKLQSVNDVLGKKTKFVKATKKPNGKEKMSLAIRKKHKKSTDEAIIIVKSSEDESENSQDHTEFKARREFLMSGLPESLKKQIAKKAAALEAYSAANSCFQKVIHVQQKDDRCSMWRLAPLFCSFLTKLKDVDSEVTDVAKLTLSLGELSVLTIQSNSSDSAVVVPSGWRPVFSQMQRDLLLEEVQSSNPQLPVKLFFDLLLKKQTPPENNKQVNKCESVNSETIAAEVQKEGKRKRKSDDRKCKRKNQKEKSEPELSKSPSQIPCAKLTDTENSLLIDKVKVKNPEVKTTEDSLSGSKPTSLSDFVSEDMLWTEKYQPQNSSELIGNTEAIKKLQRWLCEWKRKADWEENRTQKEKKNGSRDDSSEHLDFIDDTSVSDEENVLCNTMLLIGPSGVGKTAAVYACAQELGFKIFEVNASCQRSGRQILSQLKEATQSHQVNKQGVHGHKPCFFNHYSSTKSPKKQSPRKEWSPRKFPVSPRKVGLKQGLMPKTLDKYFNVTSKLKNQEEKIQRSNKENRKSLTEKKTELKSGKRRNQEEESSNKCATSLILFEEVDIIFDEDVGFLNAVKTFMSTTKRPVILTTNDPLFSEMFDGCFEQITFRVPSLINVASYLQVLCLAENLRTNIRDFAALLTVNNCDIRQSILYLQFWVQSGAGYLKEKGNTTEINGTQQNIKGTTSSNSKKSILENIPQCSTGCTENLLGLKNIFLPSEDLFSFLKREIRTKEDWNKLIHLLTEFQMRNTDFTYSNFEIISSLPLNIIPEAIEIASPACSFIAEKASNRTCIDIEYVEEAPPMKKAKRSKCPKKMAVLDDSDLFECGLNYSGFVTLSPDTSTSCLEEAGPVESTNVGTMALKDGTSVNAKDSVFIFQCLNSLTEFLDNMSFLDCCFTEPTQASKQAGKYEDFIWTKGKIKNGLSDEFSAEYTDWWSSQSSGELKATMEALSFKKCSKSISKIMKNQSCLNCSKTLGKNKFEELTLHVSKERADLYFGRSAANSSVHYNAQKRIELIKTVFSSTPLSLNNRQANVMEYLPILRNICKSEKQKEQGKTKRRFLHYLEGIHLPKEILNSLATDFP